MRPFSVLVRKFILFIALLIGLYHPAGAQCAALSGDDTASFSTITTFVDTQEKNPSESAAPSAQEEVKTSPTVSGQPAGKQMTAPPPEEKKPAAQETEAKPEERKEAGSLFDLLHAKISGELLSTAAWLDSFFGDERFVLEQNRSYLRVRYDLFQEERAKILLRPAFDLRLVLPQLEKKTHLVFSAEPAVTPAGTGTPISPTGEQIATTEERNLTTALHYLFRSVPGESFIVRTGVQLHQGKPFLFVAPRYRSLSSFGSWDIRFTQEATYRTDTQWQTDTLFDFEHKLPRDFFFRTTVEGLWFANAKGYFYSLGFSLREVFDATHALDYEWTNIYRTRPTNELAEVALRVRYRHSFWREWLFYEVAPQIRFPRSGNFDILPGILFRLEAYFGRSVM